MKEPKSKAKLFCYASDFGTFKMSLGSVSELPLFMHIEHFVIFTLYINTVAHKALPERFKISQTLSILENNKSNYLNFN